MSEIRDFVMNTPLFGNHDHQAGIEGVNWENPDMGSFFAYADADFSCSDPQWDGTGLAETWPHIQTTGYGQGTQLGIKEVLDMEFNGENSDQIIAALKKYNSGKTGMDIYKALYEKANVSGVINDCCWTAPTDLKFFTGEFHPEFFKFVLRYDNIMCLQERGEIEKLEKDHDWAIQSLSDLTDFLDWYTEQCIAGGKMAAYKIGVAYRRHLDFENSSEAAAESVFSEIMQGKSGIDKKPLHDFIFHDMIRKARKFNLPVQIHTGYLAGLRGDITQGDPAPLIPVFQKYKNVRFDLFHAAWPYSELLGAIGKEFPNTWIDLCWAWAMNPVQMERILDEWLACVPNNKIFGFGADTGHPFVVPGYAKQARIGIANVLDKKVRTGEYDQKTAKFVAERVMYKNGMSFYSFPEDSYENT